MGNNTYRVTRALAVGIDAGQRAVRALRARLAQDTPSEPAAWGVLNSRGDVVQTAEGAHPPGEWRNRGIDFVPLFRHPARVAAAPTDDEHLCASCSRPFCAGCGHPLDLTQDYGHFGCCAMTVEDLRRQADPPAPTGDLRHRVEQAVAGTVHVASEAAATVDAVMDVLAAPTGDEDLAAWLDGDAATQAVYAALDRTDMHGVPDMTAHAETYARLRGGWRFVPPAPTGEDDAPQCRWCDARAEGDEVHEGGALVPSCGAHGLDLRAPLAAPPGEDDAAVERALTQHQVEWIDPEVGWACGCDEDGNLDLPDETAARKHQARAVLAAARGPRTPGDDT